MWYSLVQTEYSHQTAWEWFLSEKSECIEWAAAGQQRELNQHQQLQEQEQQHMHGKEWGLCELSALRHILIQHLHCCCCCCCCWACCMRVSAEIFNQERFHIQKMTMKKLKKKEKEIWGEVYNSPHWQLVNCHLNCTKKKTMCQQAIRTLSVNLTCTKQTNMC